MKLPVFHHKYKCWKCNKETEIFYPEEIAYQHKLGNVKKVYSKTMQAETIGNICDHCNSYQGNWFMDEYIMVAIYEDGFLNSLIWIEADVKCKECGELIDYDIDNDQSTIWDFFNGYYGNLCHSCINYGKVEEFIGMLKDSPVCKVCKKIILNSNFEDLFGYILNDDNIVLSLPQQHHINYLKDKTITVCSQCHAKIHHSKDAYHKEYKPVGSRADLSVKREYVLVPCAGGCGKNAKVRKDEYNPDKAYSCYNCNQKANRWVAKVKAEREKRTELSYIEWWKKHG